MAYTPINWQTGDTITAEKLNKMDNGWGVESTQLFSETVTTADQDGMNMGTLAYSSQIDAPTLAVTFDGTTYTCPAIELNGSFAYGGIGATGPDFTDFPFALVSAVNMGAGNMVYTETAGTHAISAAGDAIVASSNFHQAVMSVGAPPMLCVSGTTTYDDMMRAYRGGRILFFKPYGDADFTIGYIFGFDTINVYYTPETSDVTAAFNNDGIFTVTIS